MVDGAAEGFGVDPQVPDRHRLEEKAERFHVVDQVPGTQSQCVRLFLLISIAATMALRVDSPTGAGSGSISSPLMRRETSVFKPVCAIRHIEHCLLFHNCRHQVKQIF